MFGRDVMLRISKVVVIFISTTLGGPEKLDIAVRMEFVYSCSRRVVLLVKTV